MYRKKEIKWTQEKKNCTVLFKAKIMCITFMQKFQFKRVVLRPIISYAHRHQIMQNVIYFQNFVKIFQHSDTHFYLVHWIWFDRCFGWRKKNGGNLLLSLSAPNSIFIFLLLLVSIAITVSFQVYWKQPRSKLYWMSVSFNGNVYCMLDIVCIKYLISFSWNTDATDLWSPK